MTETTTTVWVPEASAKQAQAIQQMADKELKAQLRRLRRQGLVAKA